MKAITTLVAGLLLAATATVHAQSYMVRANGVVLTLDEKGFVYDLNQFVLPYMITVKGGMFYVTDKRVITTIDENGFFYRLDPKQYEAPRKVEHSGHNYFLEGNGTVWSFDRNGSPTIGERNWDYRKPLYVGGKFFVVKAKRDEPASLVIVNDRGTVNELRVKDLDASKIVKSGTNWFAAQVRPAFSYQLYTLDADGKVYQNPNLKAPAIIGAKGGNFLEADGELLTIDERGTIVSQGTMSRFGTISKIGHNYFLTQEGKLFVVDMNGTVIERTGVVDLSNIALTTL